MDEALRQAILKANNKTLEQYQQELEVEKEKSPITIMGRQLVEKDIQIMLLQTENADLNQQSASMGQQIVGIDIRLMEGGL